MKSKITRRNKKQKGGILLKMKANEAFAYFVNNSTIKLLTDGSSFGIILKAKLNTNLESPYEIFGVDNFKQPVQNLLIKIVALSPDELDEDDNFWSYLNGETKQIDLQENFIKEVNVQTDIFFKTMEYLEPLCPAPVYSTIIDDRLKMKKLIELLDFRTQDYYTKTVFSKIIDNIYKHRIPSFGIIGMEIAEDFDTMSQFYNDCEKESDPSFMNYYEWCEQMCKLQILNLALKTGYSQNDFHRGNLLINPKYKGFYKDLDGKVIIIDFGFATKLSPDNLAIIQENYNQGKYSEALKVFKTLSRSDELEIKEYPTFYGWLYNDDKSFKNRSKLVKLKDKNYDKKINELIQREEAAIDDRIKYFDEKHRIEPDKYPLLPLSNAIKNSFFQGMIEGGKKNDRKKNNRKTRKQR